MKRVFIEHKYPIYKIFVQKLFNKYFKIDYEQKIKVTKKKLNRGITNIKVAQKSFKIEYRRLNIKLS